MGASPFAAGLVGMDGVQYMSDHIQHSPAVISRPVSGELKYAYFCYRMRHPVPAVSLLSKTTVSLVDLCQSHLLQNL